MTIFSDLLSKISQLFNWIYTIEPWERGLRVRAGKHVTDIMPGIHTRIPFIDIVYKQNIRIRACGIDAQTITTLDGDTITFNGSIRYRISSVRKMYENVHAASDTIRQEIMGKLANYITTHKTKDCTPDQVHDEVSKELDFKAYGFADVEFFLTNFVKARTYRLISGNIESYFEDYVNMNKKASGGTPRYEE